MALDISVVAPLWQDRPGNENLEVARIAAELGYRRLWVGEMATYDAFALATALGLVTDLDITVGPLAVGVRTATSMAIGIASVSDLIGRPVRLAIGASSPVVVGQWHGRVWSPSLLSEAAEVVRTLLDGGRTDHSVSRGYRLRLDPPGAHVTLAAFGPKALAAGGQSADRVVFNMVTPEAAALLVAEVDAAAEKAERPRPAMAVWLVTAVDPGSEARAQMAAARVGYLAAPGYDAVLTEAGFGDLVAFARTRPHPQELAAAIPPELDSAVGLVGSVAEIRQRVDEYRTAGIDEVCLVPVTAGDPGARRTLAALAGMPD